MHPQVHLRGQTNDWFLLIPICLLHWHKRLNKSQFTSKVPTHNNKLSTKRRGRDQEETEERREEGPNSLMLSLCSILSSPLCAWSKLRSETTTNTPLLHHLHWGIWCLNEWKKEKLCCFSHGISLCEFFLGLRIEYLGKCQGPGEWMSKNSEEFWEVEGRWVFLDTVRNVAGFFFFFFSFDFELEDEAEHVDG